MKGYRLSSSGRRALLASASVVSLGLLTQAPAHAQSGAAGQPAATDQRAIAIPPEEEAASGSAAARDTATVDGAGNSAQAESVITVTGSRIMRNGAEQPTPVTVLSASELTATASSMLEGLREVPQLSASTNEQNTGNMGPVNFLDLRALGPNRTLVLLDGRRLTPATTGTAPNVNALPTTLVQRVDVVTGGASAAYGSDAVAGVVNFVLDTKFKGLKGGVQYGITEAGDNQNYTLSLTGGFSFAGGRGHLIASAEYFNSEGALISDRPWARNRYLPITNPAISTANPSSLTNPNIIIAPNAGASRTPGGVIVSGPLRGITFGPNGSTGTYDFGTLQSGIYQIGGDSVNSNRYLPLAHRQWRWNAFSHLSYDLTDGLSFFGEAVLSENQSYSRTFPPQYDLPIFSGNAFLPASVQASMTALGLPSITVGKLTLDWKMRPGDDLYDGGLSIVDDNAKTKDFTAGFSGKFGMLGQRFSWSGYYQHGTATYERHVPNDPVNIRLFNAMDAVVVSAANRGSSNLPIGSIVCRTTLTNPGNGCIPLNIFGANAYSQAALNDIYADAWFKQKTKQDAAAINLQGTLFQNWAGDVSAAVGAEWRSVKTVVTSDPLSQTLPRDYLAANASGTRGLPAVYLTANPGVFLFGNYQPINGSYNVKEAYAELLVPLARHTRFARKLELNGAVRYADYSRSGGVWTWKAGLVYEPSRDFRFRATRSRDVRAPNIIELFSAARQSPIVVQDPQRRETYQVPTFQRGNPNLLPEKADTTALGLVFQPHFVPGLMASVDLYDIKIGSAIATPQAQEIVDDCERGNKDFCALIDRDSTNRIIQIRIPNSNVAEFRVQGADIELGYNASIGPGRLVLRGILTYIKKLSQASIISTAPVINRAGEIGPTRGLAGLPKWSGTFSASYSEGPFNAVIEERFVGSGKYGNSFNTDKYNLPGTPITYVSNNDISAAFYTDLTLRYKFRGFGGGVELYGMVNNLFNQAPKIAPNLTVNMEQTVSRLYDVLGRRFTVGLRFQF
jgi:outer membrane receptor protein involved in Fe transport